ncbi:MAG TPA: putative maltokinase [Anaeromyxobacteraceae bacterium]|jgi:trehalose synthase-fused probable maltokinase
MSGDRSGPPGPGALPRIEIAGAWGAVFSGAARARLEAALPGWLLGHRWFGGKGRTVRSARILDAVPLPAGPGVPRLALAAVSFAEGPPETYVLPFAFSRGEPAGDRLEVAVVIAAGERGVVRGAGGEPSLAAALLDVVAREAWLPGEAGGLAGFRTRAFGAPGERGEPLDATALGAEQSNTSFRLGERAFLKLFRRTAPGRNPDLEIGIFLTEAGFRHAAPVLGGIEYRPGSGEPMAVAILQEWVPNRGDAWRHALAAAAGFLERAGAGVAPLPLRPTHPLDAAASPPPPQARALAGSFLDQAALLGRRTAELHLALASRPDLEDFAPEPLGADRCRALRDELAGHVRAGLSLLRAHRPALPASLLPLADRVLARAQALTSRGDWLVERPVSAALVRTHGDLHLGQVLWTGEDFVITDFEGEPARPLAARRARCPALRDVAGMLRSFQYAALQALADRAARLPAAAGEGRALEAWARAWAGWASAAFLGAWLDRARGTLLCPEDPRAVRGLLDVYLLEKAIYELGYEIDNRPGWVGLPLAGLADLAEADGGAG